LNNFTVLGASGYIGSHLVAHLRRLGHSVWAPGRGDEQVFKRQLGHVFYCIGLTADFRSRPLETVDAHLLLLSKVLQQAEFDSLLYLSSTRIYMGAASTNEDTPLTVLPNNPSYLYNLTKLTGESLCHSCDRAGLRVARLSNVVGPGMDEQSGNLVADLLRQARLGKMVLRSDPNSAKDYIHVDDVVNWLPEIALRGSHLTYNVASGIQTTHMQWVHWLCSCYDSKYVIQNDALNQSFMPISVARLQEEFCIVARPVWDGVSW
jgi:nucleoside-diphosphate-sugar epimerase